MWWNFIDVIVCLFVLTCTIGGLPVGFRWSAKISWRMSLLEEQDGVAVGIPSLPLEYIKCTLPATPLQRYLLPHGCLSCVLLHPSHWCCTLKFNQKTQDQFLLVISVPHFSGPKFELACSTTSSPSHSICHQILVPFIHRDFHGKVVHKCYAFWGVFISSKSTQ